jgi:Flp pilus assembly protein TadG
MPKKEDVMSNGSRVRTVRRAWRRDQRGVTTILFAAALLALLGIAALVVDAGGAYAQRRKNQSIADLTALAGSQELPGNPSGACTAAWGFLKANLSDLPSGATTPCGSFPTTCDSSATNAANYTVGSSSPYTITFRYPLPDGDALLGSARTQDGTNRCERIGISVSRNAPVFFARTIGAGSLSATGTAVARHSAGTTLLNVANLVELDPFGCTSIDDSGSGTTQVIVGQVGPPLKQGSIGVDSDGTACSSQATTIGTGGSGDIWAEPTSGSTPGQIELYAQAGNQSTCSTFACSAGDVQSGRVAPQPIDERARVTRAVSDFTYNCKTGYPAYPVGDSKQITIPDCDTGGSPYIDNLNSAMSNAGTAAPTGYLTIDSGTNGGCNPSSETLAAGNYWVNCTTFKVNNNTTVDFPGGNVVFTGSVSVSSGSSLTFNDNNPTATLPSSCLTSVCIGNSSQNASFVYVVNGSISSGGTLYFDHSMVYVAPGTGQAGCTQNIGGSNNRIGTGNNNISANGSGAANKWVAPNEGPFKNLALWAEGSTTGDGLAGGGSSLVDGVLFTPYACPFTISGGFTTPETAQFISFQLKVTGGGTLTLNPDTNRLLKTAPQGAFLIR